MSYWILQRVLIASQGPQSLLKKAVKGDWKGKLSPVYAIAIAAAFRMEWVALGIYILVAPLWLVPDRRSIERVLAAGDS